MQVHRTASETGALASWNSSSYFQRVKSKLFEHLSLGFLPVGCCNMGHFMDRIYTELTHSKQALVWVVVGILAYS